MLKKFTLVALLAIAALAVNAQNLQLHYDFGEDREFFTTTLEMFKPDQYGSTFFFVDMDYSADKGGVGLAYWEISRDLKFWEGPFTAHLEFDGGFGQFKATPFNGAYSINNAYLFGPAYSWNNETFTRGFTFQALYKYITDKHDASFQLTAVWYMHFLEGKLTFSGFADFWREDNVFGTNETSYVFLSEPQLWYNFNKHFSLGGEVELSNNFAGVEGFKVCPTLGAKWVF